MTIEEAAKKFHWIKIADDGVVEMYLDHHMLSTFRSCEAKFELDMMANIKSKYRSWNLELGILWHKMVEVYYLKKQAGTFDLAKWLEFGVKLWQLNNMEEFAEHKMCKTLCGMGGFLTMCAQYAEFFAKDNDRLRVIGIEITFGKKKEVPIGFFNVYEELVNQGMTSLVMPRFVRCYLTGRIDFLADNGTAIGPLDHKTTSVFGKKNMSNEYDPQEGMTGYVFASREIIKQKFPELLGARSTNYIWMNFAQVTPNPNALERFKRAPLYKTEFQLEEWRLRQLRTFHKIYDMIVLGERPDWNTSQGCKFFNSDCTYKRLHQQNSSSNMVTILGADFKVGKPWNTEEISDDEFRSTLREDVTEQVSVPEHGD